MPKIHIATPDGEQLVIEEFQLQAKFQAGTIPAASLYWKEGMTEWQPIASLLPDPASPAARATASTTDPGAPLNPYAAPAFHEPSPAWLPAGAYAFVKNPRRLTDTLTVLFALCLLSDLVLLVLAISQQLMIGQPFTAGEEAASDARIQLATTISSVVFLLTAVCYCRWIYRAVVNSQGFGARGMKDGPGWTVGWYFVPIMNFFRPYQNMREIWQVSGDPRNWQAEESSGLLVIWWTCWIVSGILSNFGIFSGLATTVAGFHALSLIFILSILISLGTTIAAIKLTRTIIQRQETLVARSRE